MNEYDLKMLRHINECGEEAKKNRSDGLYSSYHFIMVSIMREFILECSRSHVFFMILKCVSCAFISRLSCVRVSKHVVYKHATHSTSQWTPLHTENVENLHKHQRIHTRNTNIDTMCIKIKAKQQQQQQHKQQWKTKCLNLKEFFMRCARQQNCEAFCGWTQQYWTDEFRSNRTLHRLNNETNMD